MMDGKNEKSQKNKFEKNRRKGHVSFPVISLGISLVGFLSFYLIPFIVSFIYALTDNPVYFRFVGVKNFIELFHNKFFVLGLKNTLMFMALAIPLGIIMSLSMALAVKDITRFSGLLIVMFLIPLVMPSATIAQYWLRMYLGGLNRLRISVGLEQIQQLGVEGSRWFMVSIFVWKYLGYNMVLFLAGLHAIPKEYYQCAAVLGADKWQRFRYVTIPYLSPSFFIVFIMSFVNSFKIFREIYFIYGGYPAEGMYLLQHFMNSTLLSMHYHKLVSAVYVLTLLVSVVVVMCYQMENRIADNLVE